MAAHEIEGIYSEHSHTQMHSMQHTICDVAVAVYYCVFSVYAIRMCDRDRIMSLNVWQCTQVR